MSKWQRTNAPVRAVVNVSGLRPSEDPEDTYTSEEWEKWCAFEEWWLRFSTDYIGYALMAVVNGIDPATLDFEHPAALPSPVANVQVSSLATRGADDLRVDIIVADDWSEAPLPQAFYAACILALREFIGHYKYLDDLCPENMIVTVVRGWIGPVVPID